MCWTNTLPHQWLLYVVNSYCLDEELLLLFFTVFKSWIPKLSFSVKITWSILLFRCFFMASAIWFWMSIFEGQNLVGNCRNMVSWKKSFLHKHFQQSFHLWNTCNIVFPNHLPDMVFQSLVYRMEQTCRLKNTKCIKSSWLQKSVHL